ncbi:ATP-binding protein [Streptosporangium sp. NPDC023615]|uniref:ATP-binding protein n=1 Tax=Streptosporangium sp. NPDC023615 TaxID=3154794 RepID=UPI00341D3956
MEEALKASVTLTEYRYTMNPGLSPLGERWIPREPRVVASARRFVRDVADDWNATGDVPEIAELLASELVTNAIAHGSSDIAGANPIRIMVTGEKRLLTVDVYDSCIEIPRLGQVDDLETSGRGLAIVEDLSHNWGWTLNPYGKSVWFQLVAWP